MMEKLFCQRYYHHHHHRRRGSLPDRAGGGIRHGYNDDYERLCKIKAVQSAMAYVGGITSLVDSLVGRRPCGPVRHPG